MAMAAIYYYEPDSKSCLLCKRETSKYFPFKHSVSELFEKSAEVPVHRLCYKMRFIWSLMQFVLMTLLLTALLSLAELYFIYHNSSNWSELSGLLIFANIVIAAYLGSRRGVRSYRRLTGKINHYIQLRTYPVD